METLVTHTQQLFEQHYSTPAQFVIQAPGRVNLIGEHTDYNDGFVLPCAINFKTVVCANKRDDGLVNVVACDYNQAPDSFSLDAPIKTSQQQWANYIRGVVKHLQQRGYQFRGADIVVSGNIPQGTGLSSSASLEVAIGQTFKALYQLDISQTDIALNGQAAENQFVGCNCGIMDQLISAQALKNHASLIDCRSLEVKPVPLPSNWSVLIVNSNKKRGLVDSEYNTRRLQCEKAASILQVAALRDVDVTTFEANKNKLDPLTAKRAKHVITENQRTLAAADAMANGDMAKLELLMGQSHISMRDDFEITVPEIDCLVDIIKRTVGEKGGVRMTGGGFGGCVVAVMPKELVGNAIKAIDQEYQTLTGLIADTFVCSAENGAGVLIPHNEGEL